MLAWEKAKLITLNAKEEILDNAILSHSTELRPMQPGYLNLVSYKSPYKAQRLLKHAAEKIQCVVGNGFKTEFGKTQFPALNDFQDGTDVIAEIYRIREKSWKAAKANT